LEYAVPTVPEGSVALIDNVDVAAATTIESLTVWLCAGLPASVTVTLKLPVPLAVGVPEIKPVDVFMLSPAGILPEARDQV
jgi:hypothetical protein